MLIWGDARILAGSLVRSALVGSVLLAKHFRSYQHNALRAHAEALRIGDWVLPDDGAGRYPAAAVNDRPADAAVTPDLDIGQQNRSFYTAVGMHHDARKE